MPRRMRMIDEETLRDEIRENPKSTRWVSKRGLVRKKRGGGKGKGDAVDEGQARERRARDMYEREKHARDMYEREKHRRQMSEIDALAGKMHARDMYEREKHQRQMSEIDALARKMHARAMHDRQVHTQELYESQKREMEKLEREELESEKLERDLRAPEMHAREMHDGQTLGRDYERQMDQRDMPERLRRNLPPSDHGRRSDPHHHADHEDEYDLPHRPHRGARPSRRRSHHDDDENDPEAGGAFCTPSSLTASQSFISPASQPEPRTI